MTLSRSRPSFGLRLWRAIASPWWTLLLLLLLALTGLLSLFLPQVNSTQVQLLSALQGRYGRWMGPLRSLGLFDISRALWFQVLLTFTAFQGLVAAAEEGGHAWGWLYHDVDSLPRRPPSHARKRKEETLSSPLAQSVTQVRSALQRLGYRVHVAQDEGGSPS
ncbi:MAG: cytochrome c biogenesis protein ResB [Chloroflexota bacterium]|nr:cytochrome c biogenesis protein ResB [Chloroflexota bacterium]